MKKKIVSVILAAMMIVTMGGCKNVEADTNTAAESKAGGKEASTEAAEPAENGVYPAEKVLIGVEMYDPTDTETIALRAYFSYLEEHLNIEFKYSEAIGDAADEMKFIEDCAISGCKAFMANYNVTGIEQVNAVTGYNMYFWGLAEDGGADFGVEMFVNRQAGFLDGLGDADVEVITVSGFPGDQFFADQSAALSQEGVQAVVASFNGVNFWSQPIETAGLKDTVKLATIGSVNNQCIDAFESGSLSFLSAANYQRYGLGVGVICNAVDGNADALKEDGLAINKTISSWGIYSADECKKYADILENEKVFDVEAVKSLCVNENPKAGPQTLDALIESAKGEALLSRGKR